MVDFYFYCVRRHPVLIKYLFIITKSLVRYKMCAVSRKELMELCKKYVKAFLSDCPDARDLADGFWKKYSRKLKPFYSQLHKEDDIVISASFGFLLRGAMERIGVKKLVCSELCFETGEITRLCFRENKRELFLECFGESKIDDFYTDSLNDLPLMQMAKRAYLVKGNKICEYNVERG